jgi:type II secretory pathway pseudopilin PulG
MKPLNNQTGSALNMVLVAVIIIGIFTAPMLMSAGQGTSSAIRAQNDECALYMVESALDMMKNALDEAINGEAGISVGLDEMETFVGEFNTKAEVLFAGTANPPQIVAWPKESDEEKILEISASCGTGEHIMDRTITLKLDDWQQGNANSNEFAEVFGSPGVASSAYTVRDNFVIEDNNGNWVSLSFEKVTDTNEYTVQFNQYFDSKLAERTSYLSANEIITQGYSLDQGEYNLSGQKNSSIQYSGNIMVVGDSEVKGNLVSGGNITIESNVKTLVIEGDLVAEGNITIRGGVESIYVLGDVKAANIAFEGSAGTFKVDGNVLTKGNLSVNDISDFTVGESLSVNGNISFSGNGDTFYVGDSIFGTNVSFNKFNDVIIEDTVYAGGNIAFQHQINNLDIGGSMLAKGNISTTGSNGKGGNNAHIGLNVGDFIGAIGNISFTSKVSGEIGGITSASQVYYGHNANNGTTIKVTDSSPQGGSSSSPIIDFGNWTIQ